MQETYETIPGPSKITYLLQAIRNNATPEEVWLNNLGFVQIFRGTWRREEEISADHFGIDEQVWR